MTCKEKDKKKRSMPLSPDSELGRGKDWHERKEREKQKGGVQFTKLLP